jgi:hypothetical protein
MAAVDQAHGFLDRRLVPALLAVEHERVSGPIGSID